MTKTGSHQYISLAQGVSSAREPEGGQLSFFM